MGTDHASVTRTRVVVATSVALAGALMLSACTPTASAGAPGASASASPGTQNTRPSPAVTVPAPGGGSVTETVAPAEPGATTEAGIDEPADLPDGIRISVASAREIEVTAETPGEVAGPAVAVTLTVDNPTQKARDLSTAMVSLTGSGGTLGQPTTSDPYAPFAGVVPPGGSATGTYVFLLPIEERDALSITVEYLAGAPIALFAGDITKESR